MKIALISEHASPLATLGGVDSGGQNVYVAQIARQLAAAGHRVDVFTRCDSPRLPPVSLFASNVRVIHVPAGPPRAIAKEQLLRYMDEFSDYLIRYCQNRGRYDVVHANFFMSGLAAMRLRAACGSPFVITFHALGKLRREHQGSADGFPPQRMEIERILVDEADRIIAECPQDTADLVRLYDADPRRVTIAPCGFDPDELWPDALSRRAHFDLRDDEFVVLQLGRLVPRKGIDNVIRAVAELRRTHGIEARLLVVGGDSEHPDPDSNPEIGRLSALARNEGVADRVRFMGRCARSGLRDLYCAADVFVTTPWYEPFGITPLEAMACGRPVIGAAVGGIQYSVVDGVTGFLVPPREPSLLAERLARLHGDPALGRSMGRAGMRRVQMKFTWKQVTAQLLGVYAAVRAQSRYPATFGRPDREQSRIFAAG